MAPAPLMALSLGSTALGAGISAASTIAGGSAQANAANYQAAQLRENAAADIASGQRRMLDTQQRTRLAMSTSTANAAASGVNAGVGSPAANVGALAARGSYQSMMDLWNGQNQATGELNRAAGVEYSGQIAKQASRAAALGTIAGGVGQMSSIYGRWQYPMMYGGMGMYG